MYGELSPSPPLPMPPVPYVALASIALLVFTGVLVRVRTRALARRVERADAELRRVSSDLRREGERRSSAERELHDSQILMGLTMDTITDGVVTLDVRGRVTSMNREARSLTAHGDAEPVGLAAADVLPAMRAPAARRLADLVREALAGASHGEDLALEPPVFDPLVFETVDDDVERRIEVRANTIRDLEGGVVGAVLILRDVTAQRIVEEEQRKAQKLESVGVLAGGIAHDFNNILTGIVGNATLARESLEGSREREAEELLRHVLESCDRAQVLTNQLLTFARGGLPVKKVCSLGRIVLESASFTLRGSKVRGIFELPPLRPVEADPDQLSQVVSNLVVNAIQAMPDGGSLEVRGENVDVGPGDPALPPGRYVRIVLSDTGSGIAPGDLGKVFDPYFTTKDTGSGLGLAAVHSIVRNHDGAIRVSSALGKGAEFELFFPATTGVVVPVEAPHPQEARPSGGQRVLVMDDDDAVRRVLAAMFESLGYEVQAVANGQDAVDAFEAAQVAGDPFPIVLLDLTVPGGMGGKEVMRRLRELDDRVLGIVASGYSHDPVLAEFGEYGFAARLAKPLKLTDLRDVMARLEPHASSVRSSTARQAG